MPAAHPTSPDYLLRAEPGVRRSLARRQARGALALAALLALAFAGTGAQIVRLAGKAPAGGGPRLAASEPIARTWVRPDITDRRGRLLATDVPLPSLYADPAMIGDVGETVEKLKQALPELDAVELLRQLSDPARRFVWVRRGLRPVDAQRVVDLGLAGLGFRREARRAYPAGTLGGHVLGAVNIDNKGVAGIERYIDETVGVEAALAPTRSRHEAVRLSLDLGAQHAVAEELKAALARYRAKAAAALVMDAASGEIVAAVSLPEIDPARPTDALDQSLIDRLMAGSFELGSVFKIITMALGLDTGATTLERIWDVRAPLQVGGFTIRDLYPQRRPLSAREVFIHSSNVGSGMIALEAGTDRQRDLLGRLGLLAPMRLESGPVAAPQLPANWGRTETVTIAYGHGLAVAPVQLAAAVASIVNGGTRVRPTVLARGVPPAPREEDRVVSATTSARIREIMRQAVSLPHGSGRKAEVAGLEIGGKTGTAEMPGQRGYQAKAVISTFVAIVPASAPRYVALVSLFEPQGTEETRGQITAGNNAAPTAGRIIARLAHLVGLGAAGP